jgi:hypothetical protein
MPIAGSAAPNSWIKATERSLILTAHTAVRVNSAPGTRRGAHAGVIDSDSGPGLDMGVLVFQVSPASQGNPCRSVRRARITMAR